MIFWSLSFLLILSFVMQNKKSTILYVIGTVCFDYWILNQIQNNIISLYKFLSMKSKMYSYARHLLNITPKYIFSITEVFIITLIIVILLSLLMDTGNIMIYIISVCHFYFYLLLTIISCIYYTGENINSFPYICKIGLSYSVLFINYLLIIKLKTMKVNKNIE